MNPLIDAVAGAFRERTADGRIVSHPAWHDLNADERLHAFDAALADRAIEAALDPAGRSATVRAVLARLPRG